MKTPEQLAIQKAIVCIYLRKRAARAGLLRWRTWHRRNKYFKEQEEFYFREWLTISNDLTILKRVLYHNDWS